MKNKGLGRGLDALLNNNDESDSNVEGLTMLNIEQLLPGEYQPRQIMNEEALDELAESIKEQGIMQPLLVRKKSNEKYEIIAGERRWQASKKAGIKNIPVLIKDIPDSSALAMALIENMQREDLNIIEEAKGIKKLIDNFEMTHESAAKALGKSRVAVSNILRLLNLNNQVQDYLLENKIEMGHARALLPIAPAEQLMLCQKIISQKLSVREIEKLVSNSKINYNVNSKQKDYDIERLENEISEKLGTSISINHKAKGSGFLRIKYSNLDHLNSIIQKIK
jgi:ParB family chromosome partitioning protein